MDTKNKKGLIAVGSLLLLGIASYFVYKKIKKSKAKAENIQDTDIQDTESQRTNKQVTNFFLKKPKVIASKGANIYIAKKDNSGTYPSKLSRTISKDEDVGSFIGYRLHNGASYVLFKDRINSGIESMILKTKTNLK